MLLILDFCNRDDHCYDSCTVTLTTTISGVANGTEMIKLIKLIMNINYK